MSEPSEQDEESETEIIVIGRRTGSSGGGSGSGGALLSIIARSGGTNHPSGGFIETLRGMFDTQTDYDLDTRFTAKQKEIILMALRGLADHPRYGPAMEALATKGADINIIADFSGRNTYGDLGRTAGKNPDGTIDQGESITIYINMNPGGDPVTDTAFSEAIVHELIHSLGVPAFDAELDAPGSLIDREVRNQIFSGYDFYASADLGIGQADVFDVADTGGSSAGSGAYEIFSGSDFADEIAPGAGGSLVYSGGGDDRITIVLNGGVDEIIDFAGLDTIVLPAGTPLSSISMRWADGEHNLAVMVDGKVEAIIVDAAGSGAVEQISVNGANYAVSAFSVSINMPPDAVTINATVYDSFYGGFVASAALSDGNGDTLSYRIGEVTGDYASEEWTIDANSGMLFADFARIDEPGSRYTFVTVIVSDGLDASTVTLSIRWGNSGEYEQPIGSAFVSVPEEPTRLDATLCNDLWKSPSLDTPVFYG